METDEAQPAQLNQASRELEEAILAGIHEWRSEETRRTMVHMNAKMEILLVSKR